MTPDGASSTGSVPGAPGNRPAPAAQSARRGSRFQEGARRAHHAEIRDTASDGFRKATLENAVKLSPGHADSPAFQTPHPNQLPGPRAPQPRREGV